VCCFCWSLFSQIFLKEICGWRTFSMFSCWVLTKVGLVSTFEHTSLVVELGLRATLDKGPSSIGRWNQALSFKLVPRSLDEGLGSRHIKLWFCLHGIILEGKPKCLDQNKELKRELMIWRIKPKRKLRFKVFFFLFFPYLKKNPCCSNIVRMKNMLWMKILLRKHQLLISHQF
jgi:hypothetical protein